MQAWSKIAMLEPDGVGRGGAAMGDALTYNRDQRRVYLEMIDQVGIKWVDVFKGDTEFYSAAYWDLLTEIWRAEGPVRKTDALRFMKAVKSPHTAGKYVEGAIRKGILVESDNPEDARSKLLELSPDMRGRMDAFFDAAVGLVRRANRKVEASGPVPPAD